MFEGPGVVSRYLLFVAIKFAGYFLLLLVVQPWYSERRDAFRAFLASLFATGLGEAIFLSLGTLSAFMANSSLKENGYFYKGLFVLFVLLAVLRYVAWLLVFWIFFQSEFKQRPSKGYALIATAVSFGLDLIGVAAVLFVPGKNAFFF